MLFLAYSNMTINLQVGIFTSIERAEEVCRAWLTANMLLTPYTRRNQAPSCVICQVWIDTMPSELRTIMHLIADTRTHTIDKMPSNTGGVIYDHPDIIDFITLLLKDDPMAIDALKDTLSAKI